MSAIKRVLFVGSKRIGLNVLKMMQELSSDTLIGAVTFDDHVDTRSVLDEFKTYCDAQGIPLYVLKKSRELENIVSENEPDLCMVAGWYWFLHDRMLTEVPHGFIGVHNSLLPAYRGGAPLVWAMLNGEKEVGFSLFTFTSGMDDGDVWAQGVIQVDSDDYIEDILDKLNDKAIEVMRETYPAILSGTLKPKPQNHDQVSYCAQRFPEDGNIDWSQPAQKIYNFIRAQSSPYPGAFTCYEGKKLTIWRARLFPNNYYGVAGQIAQIGDNGIHIICGDHKAIIIDEIELDGHKLAPSSIFKTIRGRLRNEKCDTLGQASNNKA